MLYVTYGLVEVCIVLVIFINITDAISEKRKIILSFIAMAAMLLIIADYCSDLYNGAATIAGGCIVRISKFLAYGLNLAIIYIFAQYLKDLLKKEGKLERTPTSLKIVDYILIAGTATLIASQFFGIYYYYDKANFYHRGWFYPGSYLYAFAALIALVYTIARHHKQLSRKLILPLLLFTIMPVVTASVHFFIDQYTLTSGSIVAMVVVLYSFSILDANDIMRSTREKEIATQKMLLSQTTMALAEAIDAKDAYTNGHSRRVAEYSAKIAEKYGKSKEYCEEIYPVKGREILSKISISPNLPIGANYHHERYDGNGYPEGLKGEDIPEIARIIAVADAYDAMASRRSYRNGLPMEKIRYELIKGMGKQFDTKFASIMVSLIDSGEIH